MKKYLILLGTIVYFLGLPLQVAAEEVHIYLFYGNTCPICEEEREYLTTLRMIYPEVQIFEFETYQNSKNKMDMQSIKEMYKISSNGVPFTVVGDTAILGFNNATRSKIESAIKKYSQEDYYDRVGVYLGLFEEEEMIKSTSTINQEQNNMSEEKEFPKEKSFSFLQAFVLGLGSSLLIFFVGYGLHRRRHFRINA